MKRAFKILILCAAMILQSCGAYYKKGIPIETAVEQSKKVKVKTKNDETIKFRRIIKEGNQYYGIKKSGKKMTLDVNQVKSIRPFNTSKAIVLNTLLASIVVANVLLALLFQGIGKGIAGATPP